jgi:hypothetical protein
VKVTTSYHHYVAIWRKKNPAYIAAVKMISCKKFAKNVVLLGHKKFFDAVGESCEVMVKPPWF